MVLDFLQRKLFHIDRLYLQNMCHWEVGSFRLFQSAEFTAAHRAFCSVEQIHSGGTKNLFEYTRCPIDSYQASLIQITIWQGVLPGLLETTVVRACSGRKPPFHQEVNPVCVLRFLVLAALQSGHFPVHCGVSQIRRFMDELDQVIDMAIEP